MKRLLYTLLFVLFSMTIVDCSEEYEERLDNLENRVSRLEEVCDQMNVNISALQTIVTAQQNQITISKIEQFSEGYIIHFSDGTSATIKNGENSDSVPIFGVRKDTDGVYYWTLDGEWLKDEQGNKVSAQGRNGPQGEQGETGATGITPQLKIEDNYWFVSYDCGKTWSQLGKATGEDGKDGADSIFKSVTEDDDNVYFKMSDETVITIPKGDNSNFSISFDTTEITVINGGETKTIAYNISGATENTVVRAIVQDGWKAKINEASISDGTIEITAPEQLVNSEILIFANDGSYRTVMAVIRCSEKMVLIVPDTTFDIGIEGGTKEITLKTNLNYSVDIPENAKSWLTLIETRATRDETLVFNISANDGLSRFATVSLKNEYEETVQTIVFRQAGSGTEIHVETKGGLETALAGYDYANIENLKITGVLNDIDFLFIRNQMPNLRHLDLAEVAITALPEKAFYKSENVTEVILPNTLTLISAEMFRESCLLFVTIPANVEIIDSYAFYHTALEEVHFESESKLKTIGGYVFFNTNLKDILIPSSTESIGEYAFFNCQRLTNIRFEQKSNLKLIGDDAFSDCPDLIICIPATVESIGRGAFSGGTSQVSFEQNSSLVSIGSGAFSNSNITSIVLPEGLEFIYSHVFAESKLQSISIPASVASIEKLAFEDCKNLTSVEFAKESNLKKLHGDDSQYSAPTGIFVGCSSLKEIEIPASITTIGCSAFRACSSLTSVKFAQGSQLNEIEDPADESTYGTFGGLTNLKEVDMSQCLNVNKIGARTFENCKNLQILKIGTKIPPTCGSGNFSDPLESGPLLILKVPDESVDLYKSTPPWNNFASITGLDE